jgi:hypothetical protein
VCKTSNALCEFANLPRFTVHRKIHSHELQKWEERGSEGEGGGGAGGRQRFCYILPLGILRAEEGM